ncbi:hypothetical protein ASD51_34015 [Streptomyces sp. Root55]|nr:hypothetical protein ASD51_34015 [Streptomyces sp. Root55]
MRQGYRLSRRAVFAFVFEDEVGFSMAPTQAKTWSRRGAARTPVVREGLWMLPQMEIHHCADLLQARPPLSADLLAPSRRVLA